MTFHICKFCGYKPSDPEARMLIWGVKYACVDCFIKEYNDTKQNKNEPQTPSKRIDTD